MPPTADELGAPWLARFRNHGLTAMLICLLLLAFVVTPLTRQSVIGPLTDGMMWAILGALSLLVATPSRTGFALIVTATAAGLLTAAIDRPQTASAVLARGFSVLAVAILGGVICSAVFASGRVTWHRVPGAIALYVIVGLMFAHLYGLLNVLVPGSFNNMPAGPHAGAAFFRDHLLHFSFETLTSSSFGDIVPRNPVVRSLTNLEAMTGQLFPATLLARLVSLELEGRRHA